MKEALDQDAYSLFLVLEDKMTSNFQFRQFLPDVQNFIRNADPNDEIEIFLLKSLDAPIRTPDWGDCEALIKWAIRSGRVELDILPYQLDDLSFGIGVLKKLATPKKSPLPTIKRVLREQPTRHEKSRRQFFHRRRCYSEVFSVVRYPSIGRGAGLLYGRHGVFPE